MISMQMQFLNTFKFGATSFIIILTILHGYIFNNQKTERKVPNESLLAPVRFFVVGVT